VKTNAPLIVDTDAISRRIGVFQLLQAVSTRHGHVGKPLRRIELTKLAAGRLLDVRGQLAAALPFQMASVSWSAKLRITALPCSQW
jgi:hypothetical protein